MGCTAADQRLSAAAQTVLIGLLLGTPLVFLASAIAFQLESVRAANRAPIQASSAPARLPRDRLLYGPVYSASHWQHTILTYASDDAGVYAANFLIAQDPEHENEVERNFEPYPPGAHLIKEHLGADSSAPPMFSTSMIRTTVPHGPDDDPWLYERREADGTVSLHGYADNPLVRAQCASCHQNAQRRDFVFHNQPPRP
jgi:hypothetical protein